MTDQTFPIKKLRALLNSEGSAADKIQAIRDLLPPAPLPYPLFLAKATHPEFGEGIVISVHTGREGYVRIMFPSKSTDDGTRYVWALPSELTFHTPDHPEFIETEEDYASAPEGTIVANNDEIPVVLVDELWRHTGDWTLNHDEMAGVRRRVLRWGREA